MFKNIEEPIMMTNGNEKWIVVLDEPKQKLFEEQWSDTKLDNEWKVYFKPHDEFWRSAKIEIKELRKNAFKKRKRN